MGVIRYTFYSEALREQTNIMAIVPSFEPWRHRMSAKEYADETKVMEWPDLMDAGQAIP